MYDKAVNNYAYALEFVLNSYKVWKMCNKAVDISPECHALEEMIDKTGFISSFLFMILTMIL